MFDWNYILLLIYPKKEAINLHTNLLHLNAHIIITSFIFQHNKHNGNNLTFLFEFLSLHTNRFTPFERVLSCFYIRTHTYVCMRLGQVFIITQKKHLIYSPKNRAIIKDNKMLRKHIRTTQKNVLKFSQRFDYYLNET